MSFLRDAGLDALGIRHGFGLRGLDGPPGLLRPTQVHGAAVARVRGSQLTQDEADAVVCSEPGIAVGVVTADCVPVLVSAAGGRAVAVIHAGWRGLAAGVVEAGVNHLAREAEGPYVAALGPCIGSCCYEVDAPVIEALRARFGAGLEVAVRPSGRDRAWLDLAALVCRDLASAGVEPGAIGTLPDCCTRCDSERFHSYRRDGPRAGRLVHWIVAGDGLDTPGGSA